MICLSSDEYKKMKMISSTMENVNFVETDLSVSIQIYIYVKQEFQ